MFYFEIVENKRILRSDALQEADAFFTTRDGLINVKSKRFIKPEQTHSDNVEIVYEKDFYKNTDGLILTNTDDAVCLKFADCTPLIFYDKKQKTGAVVHAGWRGTALKIAVKALNKMNSNPKDVTAVIGPAISLCCYEVSSDVKNQLLSTVSNAEGLFKNNNVDLKQINARQLKEAGVLDIDICPYCTSCDNDLFYSYRKENGTAERHYAVLKLKF